MIRSEILAILRFLEETRSAGLSALGVEARDPFWMMTIALLRRYYSNQRITISSLAQASGIAHATAIRHIDKMAEAGLVIRSRDRREPKLVYIEPTDELLRRFNEYGSLFKNKIGATFGHNQSNSSDFVFGGAHLAARIIPKPSQPVPPLGLESPIRILVTNEPTFLVLKRMSAEISLFLNMKVNIEVLDYEELNLRVIENGSKEHSAYDLIAIDAPWIGRMAREGIILPLDDVISKSKLNPFDFYSATWEAARCEGRHWGLMLAPSVELFLYRKDVLSGLGLSPPKTADDVLSVARRVHRPDQGFYGVAWNAARGQPLGQTFTQVMAAFGSPPVSLNQFGAGYDLDTPWNQVRPTLNNISGLRTLEFLRELAEVSPPNIRDMDWIARTAAYRMGSTAMAYEWSGRTTNFEEDPESAARGNTGYLPHPSFDGSPGISPMGGWLLGVPSNVPPSRKRGAWRALQWLATPEVTKCLIENGSPARFLHSLSADPEVRRPLPAEVVVDSMQRSGHVQVWPRPPIPYITSLMRIVGQEVHDVIWGDAVAKDVLVRAENRLKPMFDSLISERNSNVNQSFADY